MKIKVIILKDLTFLGSMNLSGIVSFESPKINWHEVIECLETEEALEYFMNKVKDTSEIYFETKESNKNKSKFKNKKRYPSW